MAVVTAEDLAEAETALKPIRDEDSLSGKKKTRWRSLLRRCHSSSTAGIASGGRYEGIADLLREVDTLGMRLSANTAKKAINDCWSRAKPSLA